MRKPLQGVSQIIRFNWHFYALAIVVIMAGFYLANKTEGWVSIILIAAALFATLVISVSLFSSYVAYDRSDLYSFSWLPEALTLPGKHIVHIHAGFDEVSAVLHGKLRPGKFDVFDFFDPRKHTELSIRRARTAYPPFPGTISVDTRRLPLPDHSVDLVFLFLSAHEIREDDERRLFFQEVSRLLRSDGTVVLTEHLRDWNNFFAYNIGFFHFHSVRRWMQSIQSSGLNISEQIRNSPFITTFILRKHG